jgi:hypothetical protein
MNRALNVCTHVSSLPSTSSAPTSSAPNCDSASHGPLKSFTTHYGVHLPKSIYWDSTSDATLTGDPDLISYFEALCVQCALNVV